MKYKSICFFYPSKLIGGAEYLFMRLANKISVEENIDVYYVDYVDGFARTSLQNEKNAIKFIDFSFYTKINVPRNSVVITPLSSILDVINFINPRLTYNILFWSIHPFGLKNVLSYHVKGIDYGARFGKSLDMFIKSNALMFMDGPNQKIQQELFGLTETPSHFLPIPIAIADGVEKKDFNIDVSNLRVTWLGRLSEEKIYALLNVIENAKQLASHRKSKITVNVIGDGKSKSLIDQSTLSPVTINMLGSLLDKELKTFLTNETDILFAMGTSALEGAGTMVPTVLVDLSYEEIPLGNTFKWLFEAKNFSLAEHFSVDNRIGHSFSELIETITSIEGSRSKAIKCFNYVKENHTIDIIKNLMIQDCEKSALTSVEVRNTPFSAIKFANVYWKLKHILKHTWKKF